MNQSNFEAATTDLTNVWNSVNIKVTNLRKNPSRNWQKETEDKFLETATRACDVVQGIIECTWSQEERDRMHDDMAKVLRGARYIYNRMHRTDLSASVVGALEEQLRAPQPPEVAVSEEESEHEGENLGAVGGSNTEFVTVEENYDQDDFEFPNDGASSPIQEFQASTPVAQSPEDFDTMNQTIRPQHGIPGPPPPPDPLDIQEHVQEQQKGQETGAVPKRPRSNPSGDILGAMRTELKEKLKDRSRNPPNYDRMKLTPPTLSQRMEQAENTRSRTGTPSQGESSQEPWWNRMPQQPQPIVTQHAQDQRAPQPTITWKPAMTQDFANHQQAQAVHQGVVQEDSAAEQAQHASAHAAMAHGLSTRYGDMTDQLTPAVNVQREDRFAQGANQYGNGFAQRAHGVNNHHRDGVVPRPHDVGQYGGHTQGAQVVNARHRSEYVQEMSQMNQHNNDYASQGHQRGQRQTQNQPPRQPTDNGETGALELLAQLLMNQNQRQGGGSFSVSEAVRSVKEFTAQGENVDSDLRTFIESATFYHDDLSAENKAKYVKLLQARLITGRAKTMITDRMYTDLTSLIRALKDRCRSGHTSLDLARKLNEVKQGGRSTSKFVEELIARRCELIEQVMAEEPSRERQEVTKSVDRQALLTLMSNSEGICRNTLQIRQPNSWEEALAIAMKIGDPTTETTLVYHQSPSHGQNPQGNWQRSRSRSPYRGPSPNKNYQGPSGQNQGRRGYSPARPTGENQRSRSQSPGPDMRTRLERVEKTVEDLVKVLTSMKSDRKVRFKNSKTNEQKLYAMLKQASKNEESPSTHTSEGETTD